MTYPAILLQAQYFNLLDRQTRHFEIRSITKDPAARRQAEDRVRTALDEVATTLARFAQDTDACSTLLNRQRAADRLVISIAQVLDHPYDRELFTLTTQAFGAFLVDVVHSGSALERAA